MSHIVIKYVFEISSQTNSNLAALHQKIVRDTKYES